MYTQRHLVRLRAASTVGLEWTMRWLGRGGLPLLCCLLASAGCNKKKVEPRITGSHSAPAVSLQCAWKPGLRYILRLEMNQLTDPDSGDPDKRQHRVTFAQESQIDIPSARQSTNLSAEVTI